MICLTCEMMLWHASLATFSQIPRSPVDTSVATATASGREVEGGRRAARSEVGRHRDIGVAVVVGRVVVRGTEERSSLYCDVFCCCFRA